MLRTAALLLLYCLSLALPVGAAERLNVVLILADDVGYECFGAYGTKQYSTPRLDRMADAGVMFRHAYSTPLCTPSRVAIMTGKSNVRNYADFGVMVPGEYTFADLFREAGYQTAIAGKWQLQGSNNVPGTAPAEAGFDSYCLWNTPKTKRDRYWNPSIERNGELLPAGKDDYGPDFFTDFLIDFMKENRDQPFFVYYPMALVHSPFLPTPDSSDRASKDEQKNFEDMVAYADKLVGRIQDSINELGLREKTVVIFTADNGTHHDINSRFNEESIRGDKGSATDPGTHVPLFVEGPGVVRGGRILDDLIDFSDFLPTLADIIGAKLPADLQIDGRSFWPQLKGEKGDPRQWQYTYYFPRPYAESFDNPYMHPEIRFVRDQRYKLYGDGRFFDLVSDPHEANVIASKPNGAAGAAWDKLHGALAEMPEHGARIPRKDWERSAGSEIPRWHD